MKMQCPLGVVSCGWRGVNFDADENGQVDVPAEAVEDLMSHGLVPLSDDAEVAEAQAEVVRPRRKR